MPPIPTKGFLRFSIEKALNKKMKVISSLNDLLNLIHSIVCIGIDCMHSLISESIVQILSPFTLV